MPITVTLFALTLEQEGAVTSPPIVRKLPERSPFTNSTGPVSSEQEPVGRPAPSASVTTKTITMTTSTTIRSLRFTSRFGDREGRVLEFRKGEFSLADATDHRTNSRRNHMKFTPVAGFTFPIAI